MPIVILTNIVRIAKHSRERGSRLEIRELVHNTNVLAEILPPINGFS